LFLIFSLPISHHCEIWDNHLPVSDSSYSPQYVPEPTSPPKEPADVPGNDGFFDSWLGGSAESAGSSMFLSSKTPAASTTGILSTETLSLMDKLEKKRAARAANMAKRNAALSATKIQRSETINKDRMVQDLGQHPQSAFTVVRNERTISGGEVEAPESSKDAELEASQEEGHLPVPEPLCTSEAPLTPKTPLTPVSVVEEHTQAEEPPSDADLVVAVAEKADPPIEEESCEVEIPQVPEPVKSPQEPHEEIACENVVNTMEEMVDNTPNDETDESPVVENEEEGREEREEEVEVNEESEEEESTHVCQEVSPSEKNVSERTDSTSTLTAADKMLCGMENSMEPQGSGWGDDVSLSILTDSTFSSKCPSDADLVAMVPTSSVPPDSKDRLEGSWEQPSVESSESSLEVVQVPMEEIPVEDQDPQNETEVSCDNEIEPVEDSTSTMETLSELQNAQPESEIEESESQPCETSNEAPNVTEAQEDSAAPEEGGDWDNDELDLGMEQSTVEVKLEAEVIEGEQEESDVRPIEEAFLAGELPREKTLESSSTSETLDSLSESNRTITAEDIDKMPTTDTDVTEGEEEEQREEDFEDEAKGEHESEANTSKEGNEPLSSSSYVKNMLEEAMTESVKDSDSHTSSEMVRIESAQNSGHTSADEIDTTTSSDIEIISHISTPTPNGDGHRTERPFDLSPLRHALSRSVRRGSPPGHKRSDSSSSGHSYHSRCGDELLSPETHREHPDHGECTVCSINSYTCIACLFLCRCRARREPTGNRETAEGEKLISRCQLGGCLRMPSVVWRVIILLTFLLFSGPGTASALSPATD
jgi:hypothetical protein